MSNGPTPFNPLSSLSGPDNPQTPSLDPVIPYAENIALRRSPWDAQVKRLENFIKYAEHSQGYHPSVIALLKGAATYEKRIRSGIFSPCSFDPELAMHVRGDELLHQLAGGRYNLPYTIAMDMGLPRRVVVSPDLSCDSLVGELGLLMKTCPTIDGLDVIVTKQNTPPFLTALRQELQQLTPNVDVHLIGHANAIHPDGGRAVVTSLLDFIDTHTQSLSLERLSIHPSELWRLLEELSSDRFNLAELSIHFKDTTGLLTTFKALSLLDHLGGGLHSLGIGVDPELTLCCPEAIPYLPTLKRLMITAAVLHDEYLTRLLSRDETPQLSTLTIEQVSLKEHSSHGRLLRGISSRDSLRALTLRDLFCAPYMRDEPSFDFPRHLEILSFNSSQISQEMLESALRLPSLKRLELSGCHILDDSFGVLVEIAARGVLHELDLRHTEVPLHTISNILESSQNLRIQLSGSPEDFQGTVSPSTWEFLAKRFGENRVSYFE